MTNEPKLKKYSYGGAEISKLSPPMDNPRVLNVYLTFEEALKLNLAIDECLRQINSYNRAAKTGKSIGLNISVKTNLHRVDMLEGKIK